MSPYEFVKLQLELDSIRSTPTSQVTLFRNRYIDATKGITLDSYKDVEGYDWQDLLLQIGVLQTHNISINGGNNDTRYAITGSYLNQKGIIINTGMKRYDAKITLDTRLNKNLKMGISASYANTETFGTIPTSGNGGGVVNNMWSFRPVDILGGQNLETAVIDSTTLSDNGTSSIVPDNLVNPLQQAQNEYRKNITTTAVVNVFLEYSFWKNFKLRVAGGYNSTTPKSEVFYNSKTSQGTLAINNQGQALNINGINGQINSQVNTNYLSENTLSYRNKFGADHVLDAVAGFTYQYAKNYGNGFRVINIPQATEYLGILGINTGTATAPATAGSQWQLFSFLSRLNYTYKDKYLFTGTVRADGSSKFAKGKQWGYFPSGALAWKFSKEKFARGLSSFLTEGKLRVSYGAVGNNKVGDFSYLSQFGSLQNSAGYPINNTYVGGIVPFFYGNENLTWETSRELDLGINLTMFKDRVSIDADYYSRTTKDFLIGVALPFFGGYGTGTNNQYQNTGRVRNSGFELTLTTANVKSKSFNWTSSFNISFNQSKILEFYNGFEVRQTAAQFPGIPTASQPTTWIAAVGAPIAQFYGYVWSGVYQYSDFNRLANGAYVLKAGVPSYAPASAANPIQPGDPKYADINADGIVDANDQKVIGRPLPIHTGGFTNNFSYKNWSLNVFMQWSYGNDVLNANKLVFESGSYYLNSNQFASYANRWTPDNPTNELPRATFNLKTDVGGLQEYQQD
jgi:TonB-linked SusC/RagA family outer membrane protein